MQQRVRRAASVPARESPPGTAKPAAASLQKAATDIWNRSLPAPRFSAAPLLALQTPCACSGTASGVAPPPPAPEIIEVVEDEEEVEETIIESTESDEEMVIEDIEVEDEFDDIEVPFAVIEDVPIYPGCEKVSKSQRRTCFQDKINQHIKRNFRYPEIAQEMGIQGRVYVNFIIGRDGVISNIRMRGPDKNLENEAGRIIGRLPQMTPGKQRGRPVRVPFSIPITFRLQ